MFKMKWKKGLAALMAASMVGIPAIPAEAAAPKLNPVPDVSEATATALAQALVGEDVKVVSAEIYGSAGAFGTFENAADLVGFSGGLVMSSGNLVQNGKDIFSGGYNEFFSTDLGQGKSYQGSELPGFDPKNIFYDLNYLDITYIPTTEYVSFQYSVASEEYPEYIHNYFDQFVLLVNGVNYALVPETNEMVTIGTVNHEHNSQYYRGMESASGIVSDTNFVYDGITVTFSVSAKVNMGQENTIRIAIADKGDAIFDSAVFIKAKSIKEQAAAPGTITVGEIVDNTLTLDREEGTDGFVSVDVTFEDDDKNVVGKENVSFNDGESQKQINVPSNATYFFLTASAGGVKVDENVSTSQSVVDFVPATGYAIAGKVTEQQFVAVSGGDAASTVSGGDAIGAADANVSLSGMGITRETKTDADGAFGFEKVKAGVYQISASKDGKTGIDIVNVNSASTGCTIELHKGNTSANVGDTGFMIGGLNALNGINSPVMDADDKKVLAENGSIDVAFNVGQASAEDVEALKQASGQKIDKAYSFDILKTAKNEAGEELYQKAVSDTQGNMIDIVMPLTPEQLKMTDFKVYRIHDGAVGVITESANADGEYIEVLKSQGVAILHVNKFSAYTGVLGVLADNEPDPDEPDTDYNEPVNTSTSRSPKTGEPEMMLFWIEMAVLAAGVVLFGRKAFKKNR